MKRGDDGVANVVKELTVTDAPVDGRLLKGRCFKAIDRYLLTRLEINCHAVQFRQLDNQRCDVSPCVRCSVLLISG